MKIKKTYKLEKAASKDPNRETLHHILIDEKEELAVATNGKILAVVPVEKSEIDRFVNGKRLLSVDAITGARKLAKKTDKSSIELNGGAVLNDGTELPTNDEIVWPAWKQVIPSAADLSDGFKVCIDAKFLLALADAINENPKDHVVQLAFQSEKPELNAIKVTNYDSEKTGTFGIIMPCRRK